VPSDGYSHIFVAGPAAVGAVAGEQEPVSDVHNGIQEIFSREDVRNLLKAYEARVPLAPVRSKLGDLHPWSKSDFRKPAPRVNWTSPTSITLPTPRTAAISTPSVAEAPSVSTTPEAVTEPAQALNVQVSPTAADQVPAPPIADEPVTNDIASLIETHALQRTSDTEAENAWLESTAQKLRSALLGYSFQAKILGTRLTPNAALIRFMGSDRLSVENIEGRQSALLTTHGLRLVAISPLPGEIVVAVARVQRQTVSLWDVWARRELNRNAAGLNTSFVLGLRELDGEILYLNLGSAFGGSQSHEPHTLVAGATGSGKSVLIQALILDIAATNPSSLAQIVLIDPKMGVDYSAIERLPHIQGGIVIDQDRAQQELERLVAEMDRRYELFRARSVRDLRSYNVAVGVKDQLPTLFLVHDEFAEWMLTEGYKEAVSANVQRLGVKARAAGIHLIFAAQRPDANVMPMQLRDNLGNRLILKVASVGTSEIALGVKGAESLLGLGHLAARLNGEPGIVFAQAPFLSDADIERVVEAIIQGDTPTTPAAIKKETTEAV